MSEEQQPTSVNEVLLDLERPQRTGLPEAVYCHHKSVDQLCTILTQLRESNTPMLFTRMHSSVYQALHNDFPAALDYDPVSRTAFYWPPGYQRPKIKVSSSVAVVTGGSSDVPTAREAVRTLAFGGQSALEINDVGVAGLWRLHSRLAEIKSKPVVICVAGMDAALPTVLGGLVASIIIAVPSSVGYGVADSGRTALNSLLCSCASGLVVVNIDNGYGAACAALRYLHQPNKPAIPR